MRFNIGKLLFFDIESVSQYKDLYDMSEREMDTWMKYYDSMRKKVTDESQLSRYKEGAKAYYNEVYRRQHSSLSLGR